MKPDKFYDHQAGPARATCTGFNSVVLRVFARPELWLFILLHGAALFAWRERYLKNWADLSVSFLETPWHDAGVITFITALAEVLYVGRCYENHILIHDLTRQMAGALIDFAFRARLCMGGAGHPHDQVACRYLVVSMVLFLLEARGFTRSSFKAIDPGETWVMDDDWMRLQEKKLVKIDEAAFLKNLKSQQRSHFLLREAGRLANEGLRKARAPPEAAEDFAGTLLTFRQRQEQALEAVRLPVPFGFFHLLNFMVMINLFFWAIALAMTGGVNETTGEFEIRFFSPIFFVLSMVLSLALLELAAGLCQPFGDSSEHLPAAEWVEDVCQNVNALLDFRYRGASNGWRRKLEEEHTLAVKLNLGRDKVDAFLNCKAQA